MLSKIHCTVLIKLFYVIHLQFLQKMNDSLKLLYINNY